jgi:hypothetical protein
MEVVVEGLRRGAARDREDRFACEVGNGELAEGTRDLGEAAASTRAQQCASACGPQFIRERDGSRMASPHSCHDLRTWRALLLLRLGATCIGDIKLLTPGPQPMPHHEKGGNRHELLLLCGWSGMGAAHAAWRCVMGAAVHCHGGSWHGDQAPRHVASLRAPQRPCCRPTSRRCNSDCCRRRRMAFHRPHLSYQLRYETKCTDNGVVLRGRGVRGLLAETIHFPPVPEATYAAEFLWSAGSCHRWGRSCASCWHHALCQANRPHWCAQRARRMQPSACGRPQAAHLADCDAARSDHERWRFFAPGANLGAQNISVAPYYTPDMMRPRGFKKDRGAADGGRAVQTPGELEG